VYIGQTSGGDVYRVIPVGLQQIRYAIPASADLTIPSDMKSDVSKDAESCVRVIEGIAEEPQTDAIFLPDM
jgi:hypothetical protein